MNDRLTVEKVKTFIASKENPLSVVGPLFLASTIALLWFFSKEVSVILPSVGLVGLAFAWVGGRTGFWIAQALIVVALLTSLWINPLEIYWQMGFAASLSISLFITFLSQTDIVDNTLQKDIAIQSVSGELANSLAAIAALEDIVKEKETFLAIARDEFLHLQQQQRAWSDEVFEEKRKAAKIAEFVEQQVLDTIDSPEYRRLNGAYTQLKEQFKEKDQILSDTRKELFQAQEQVNALTKELDEISLYGVPGEIAQLEEQCTEMERQYNEEIEHLRAEIKALEAVISSEA